MKENIVFDGKYMDIIHAENNGTTWEYAARKGITGAAGIVAITDDQKLVLIEQFRQPVEKVCIEIPAGLIGDHGPESICEGANRELTEETGYTAGQMSIIGTFPLSPGMTSEVMTMILATKLKKIGEGGGVDSDENISVIEIPVLSSPVQLLQLAPDDTKYIDSKVFMAVYFGVMEITRRIKSGELNHRDVLPPLA